MGQVKKMVDLRPRCVMHPSTLAKAEMLVIVETPARLGGLPVEIVYSLPVCAECCAGDLDELRETVAHLAAMWQETRRQWLLKERKN